LYYFSAD